MKLKTTMLNLCRWGSLYRSASANWLMNVQPGLVNILNICRTTNTVARGILLFKVHFS